MGDALCGPSNALQNFQKHASQDRTLQQDRLASRPLPTQAFRTRNPNEGALDREFNSFESTFSGPPLSDVHYQPPPFLQSATPGPAQAHHPQPGVAGWADDFQKLHISDSGMVAPPEQFQQPVHRPSTAHWQQEFSQQHSEQHNQPIQAPTNSIGAAGYRPGMMGMEFAGSGHFSAYHDAPQATQSQGPAAAETFDESAFEAAFAEARAEIELQESRLGHVEEHEASALTPEQTERIGADNIPRSQEGINDADELAKTAGQLLESVKNDTSEKFKQSNFLALMRQLRDREVAVDGDEFRHTAQSLHPGGPFYPERRRSSNLEAGRNNRGGSDANENSHVRPGPEAVAKNNYRVDRGSDVDYPGTSGFDTAFGDNNALYAGYAWDKLFDRPTAQPPKCPFRNELETHGL